MADGWKVEKKTASSRPVFVRQDGVEFYPVATSEFAPSTHTHTVITALQASNATFTSGKVVFSGSTNVTVMTAGAGANQTILFSAPDAGAGGGTSVAAIVASDATYSSGSVVFTGSNDITVRSTTGQKVVIDFSQSTHAHTAFQLSDSNGLVWGTNASTVTGSYTQSTHSHATFPSAIVASDATYTSGSVVFTGSNDVTVRSAAGQKVVIDVSLSTHSHSTGPSAIQASNATFTSGTVVFSGSTNVTVQTAGAGVNQTILFSAPDAGGATATMEYYDNMVGAMQTVASALASNNIAGSAGSLFIFPLTPAGEPTPFRMTVKTFMLDLSVSGAAAQVSISHNSSFNVALYSVSTAAGAGSTLALVNSVQSAIGMGLNANNSTYWIGQRFLTFHSSQWSAQPVVSEGVGYFVGLNFRTSLGSNATLAPFGAYAGLTGSRSGTIGVSQPATTGFRGVFPYHGVYSATTNAFPASIHQNQINKTMASAFFIPHVILNARISSF